MTATKTRPATRRPTAPARLVRSSEDRKAEVEALHGQLVQMVEDLRSPAQWEDFLRSARLFSRYSVNNVLLLQMQCRHRQLKADQVAGFRRWIELGRQVRKGEKGLRIFAPMTVKAKGVDEATGEETASTRTVFGLTSVFVKSQTDPIEGREDLTERCSAEVVGDDPTDVYGRVAAHLATLGWTVSRRTISDAAQGYATTDGSRQVVIDAALQPAAAAVVALHEAAHVICGHVNDYEVYRSHRGAMETTAQSVAWIVGTMLGIDSARMSVQYVAGWLNGPDGKDALATTLHEVMTATHELLNVLLVDDHDHAEPLTCAA